MSNNAINSTINLDGNAYTGIAQIDKALGNVLVSAKNTKSFYDTKTNVQSNELKWVDKTDKKVKIEISYKMPSGQLKKQSFGNDKGEAITRYVDTSNKSELNTIAENEYNLWYYSGYEGSVIGWLFPRVKAGGSIRLRDKKRNEDGTYYVTGVEIEFGQNGAKRKVMLGRKLG